MHLANIWAGGAGRSPEPDGMCGALARSGHAGLCERPGAGSDMPDVFS
jgi:hypothetical protein